MASYREKGSKLKVDMQALSGLGIDGVSPSKDAASIDDRRASSVYLPLEAAPNTSDFAFVANGEKSPKPPSSPSEIHPMFGTFPTIESPGPSKASKLQTAAHPSPRPFYAQKASLIPAPVLKRLDSPAAWLVYYFLLNLGLTLHNKFVLVKFPFPWSLTAMHSLLSAAGSYFFRSQGIFVSANLTTKESAILFAFSLLFTINIAVSNLSLNLVSVALHQVIRASTPLFTILIAFIFLGKKYQSKTILSLMPVIAGVAFATWGDYNATWIGFVLTVFGTFLAALKTVVTNVIQVGRLKLHPLDLLLRMSPLAFIQCVIYSYFTGELGKVREYGAMEMDRAKLIGLFGNGLIAFFLNIVSFSANKKTSALTMTVAANAKQVLTILFAVYLFNLAVTPLNLLGIVLTLAGSAYYARLELQSKQQMAKANQTPLLVFQETKPQI